MSEPFEFPNDSKDECAANEEKENTLAVRDHLKVTNFKGYVKEKQSGGKDAILLISVLLLYFSSDILES